MSCNKFEGVKEHDRIRIVLETDIERVFPRGSVKTCEGNYFVPDQAGIVSVEKLEAPILVNDVFEYTGGLAGDKVSRHVVTGVLGNGDVLFAPDFRHGVSHFTPGSLMAERSVWLVRDGKKVNP